MAAEILSVLDTRINAARDAVARTTIELVNIKSVQEPPLPASPFGAGPRAVLDAVLHMGRSWGFHCVDYGVGVVSVALQDTPPDVGIWVHGDVVPEGDGWLYPPYDATELDGCIIGRGATDNKGQLAAIFHLLRIIKEEGVTLGYNPALYVGSNEETGMADLVGLDGNPDARGFLNVCTPPRLSLVPDEGFPVVYGGKGGMKLQLIGNTPLHGWTLTAGLPDAPGRAVAAFAAGTVLSAETPPSHSAHPDPHGNMITKLTEQLLTSAALPADDRDTVTFLHDVSLDVFGNAVGIAADCADMSPLTLSVYQVTCEDGYPLVSLNIRYPMGITYDEICERLTAFAAAHGFRVQSATRGVDPYLHDKNSELIHMLCRVANEVTGDKAEPFTMSGGTYAHRLPNAYPFGMDGNLPPADFPIGHGGAHGRDEAVSLDRLQRAMHIYARALLALSDMKW